MYLYVVMADHHSDVEEVNGIVVSGHTRIDNHDDKMSVEVDELIRQLSEMECVDELRITDENGYFGSIDIIFNDDQMVDMVSEVAYSHGLRYWHSNSTDDGRHKVMFKTDVGVEMRSSTAIETYIEYGPAEDNPMGEAYTI